MEIIYLFIGIAAGGIFSCLLFKNRTSKLESAFQTQLIEKEKALQNEMNSLDKEKSIYEEKYSNLQLSGQKISDELLAERKRGDELSTLVTRAETENKNLRKSKPKNRKLKTFKKNSPPNSKILQIKF